MVVEDGVGAEVAEVREVVRRRRREHRQPRCLRELDPVDPGRGAAAVDEDRGAGGRGG